MADTTLQEQSAVNASQSATPAECDECIGSGGWFRYDPSLENSPGRMYLSCVQCRGSGRTAAAGG
ncbi:hypothetical protein LZ009_23530 [Ramlibacter sp. XY19]|uniref:hypothetical protein n=1 Tax=Ramlibacter paludis TaxID=2908000 RepID=UPI0023DB50A7|nr:hypothetical protein [Ramlibacter paludis]MCG2595761.1 hypothetical protein [Ramlibacter paludis]